MTDIVPTVLALLLLLGCVSLLTRLAEKVALPLAILLAAFGILLGIGLTSLNGLVIGYLDGPLAPLHDALLALGTLNLNAESFLFLFLPTLLFTAALSVDVRLLLDEIAAVLLLAVVAVVVCVGVVGMALWGFSSLGLVACLLLGAVIATTDPAAVVAIFRDLGAPRRLQTLVAGESLFNDAAAIAIFAILLGMLSGELTADVGAGALSFLESFLGGLLVGLAMARLMIMLLPFVRDIPAAAVTLSLVLAYLAFALAESYLEVSGVVAVVTAGLVFTVYGPMRLPPGSWSALRNTWEQLDFWANSLIFVLASMLAVRVVPQIGWSDAGMLAVLIVSALSARAFVLYLLLPGLSWLQLVQPVDQRFKLVILWGGLRGAVTLVLALSVSQSQVISPAVKDFIALLATGFVLFTLFACGATLRPLLRLLGLDRLTATDEALRSRAMTLSRQEISDQLATLAEQYGIETALAEGLVPPPPENPRANLDLEARLQVGLLTVANRERELYLGHFEARGVSSRLVGALLASADRAIDSVKLRGRAGYQQAVDDQARLPFALRTATWINHRFAWTRPLASTLADRFELLLIRQMVVRELLQFSNRALVPLIGKDAGLEIGELLLRRLSVTEDALAAVDLQFPRFAADLRRQYLTRAALRLEEAAYRRQLEESLISREVFAALQQDLSARRHAAERRPELDLGLRLAEMIGRVPLFSDLPAARRLELARLLRIRLVFPGDRIIRQGERGDSMFFIASGVVEVVLPYTRLRLSAGHFIGELALLTRLPRSADVNAIGYCHLLELEARDFRRLLKRDPALRQVIETIAAERLGNDKAIAAK